MNETQYNALYKRTIMQMRSIWKVVFDDNTNFKEFRPLESIKKRRESMNIIRNIIVVVLFSSIVLAQKHGFGIATNGVIDIKNIMHYEYNPTIVYTLHKLSLFRVEFALGYESSEDQDQNDDNYIVGLGLLYPRTISNDFKLYIGARYYYYTSKRKWNWSGEIYSEHLINIAPIIGTEYYLNNNVSLGGEIQFNYYYPPGGNWNTILINPLAFLRFYF